MAPAGRALALGIGRTRVLRVPGVLDGNGAAPGEQLAVPRVPGGQDTVEHVDPPGDALDEVVRHADPHQVSGRRPWKLRRGMAGQVIHDVARLTYGQPADCIPLEADRNGPGDALIPEVLERGALDDPELGLTGRRSR